MLSSAVKALLFFVSLWGTQPVFAQGRDVVLDQCNEAFGLRQAQESLQEVLEIALFKPLAGKLRVVMTTSERVYFPQVARSGVISVSRDFLIDSCYLALASRLAEIGFGSWSITDRQLPATSPHKQIRQALMSCSTENSTWRECLPGLRQPIAVLVEESCASASIRCSATELEAMQSQEIAKIVAVVGPYFEDYWRDLFRFLFAHEAVHYLENHFDQLRLHKITLAQAELEADVVAFQVVKGGGKLLFDSFYSLSGVEWERLPKSPYDSYYTSADKLENAVVAAAHQTFSCRFHILTSAGKLHEMTKKEYVDFFSVPSGYVVGCGKHSGPAFAYAYDRAYALLGLKAVSAD